MRKENRRWTFSSFIMDSYFVQKCWSDCGVDYCDVFIRCLNSHSEGTVRHNLLTCVDLVILLKKIVAFFIEESLDEESTHKQLYREPSAAHTLNDRL